MELRLVTDTAPEFPRSFLPASLDLGDWESVQPFVEQLLARNVDTVADLERWLPDCRFVLSYVAGPHLTGDQTEVVGEWLAGGAAGSGSTERAEAEPAASRASRTRGA